MQKIAFNGANMVGRATGWRYELSKWGEQHQRTIAHTTEMEWERICRDVASAGYRAMEIWVAHVDPVSMTDARARIFRKILDDHGLEPIGLAGTLNDATARVCQQLHLPCCNGGFWGSDLATVKRLVPSTGLKFNYENHPEKSADEIVAQIHGGGEGIGVALDTGWLGTQGIDAPMAVRQLARLIRHIHLKDVAHAGAHATCRLGDGIVNIAGVIAALKEIGYNGWYSWEDEPENRNPMEIAAEMREWIEAELAR
jgi:sugar phosphate isomerase/epimerase